MGDGPSYMNDLLVLNSGINGRNTGFIPFFGQKIQGLFKDTFKSVFFGSFTT